MQATLVISRLFDNTRPFARALAENIGIPVVLLMGDESLERGARAIRGSRRVWFEGVGPLLGALVAAPRSWQLPKACLRVGPDEVAGLPLPGLWSVVSDLIVPSRASAQAVRAIDQDRRSSDVGAPPPGRIHVVGSDPCRHIMGSATVGEDVTQLLRIAAKPPGDLGREVWKSIYMAGDLCKGRVLLSGDPPEELRSHLSGACALEIVTDTPTDTSLVDSIVFWSETPIDLKSSSALRCRLRLAPGGTVVIIAPKMITSQGANIDQAMQNPEEDLQVSSETAERGNTETAPAAAPPPNESVTASISVRTAGPMVTVVVPVYNDADRVGRCISSLRGQTWRNMEILVIDDGSTDDTAQAVAKHLDDPRVRYLYKPHSGRPGTRNMGVQEARGDYVGWLGSDDEAFPNRIRLQAEAIQRNPAIDIVHGDGFIFRPDGNLHQLRRYQPITAENFPQLLMAGFSNICPILDTTAVIRRRLYERLGLYDTAFLRCQDYDFYIRTAMAGDVVYHHVPLALVKVQTHALSPERRSLATEFYTRLALKMIEFFGPERLMGSAACDLHISPDLAMAEYLVPVIETLGLNPGDTLYEETLKYLQRASLSRSPEDRREAYRLLSVVARIVGNERLATHYLEESRNAVVAATV
jgi:hypothetical protein